MNLSSKVLFAVFASSAALFNLAEGKRTDPAGYKQVNTVLSEALATILKDGRYARIDEYNGGFGGAAPAGLLDGSACTRSWDRSEQPVGILHEAIETGVFKWCLPEAFFGEPANGQIGIAEEDIPLQGIAAGDQYGRQIDMMNALTIAMSQILHAPLEPELVVIPGVMGVFNDVSHALATDDMCYATLDWWFRHPYREATVDFTCASTAASANGFGLLALDTTDISTAIEDEGEGLTICSHAGSTQLALVERTFPLATVIDTGVQNTFAPSLCAGVCDAIVDEIDQAVVYHDATPGCAGLVQTIESIASPSSGGDIAAITHRPVYHW